MLVDDHEIVRDGIKAMLDTQDDIVVTAQAGTCRRRSTRPTRTRPDVVVMDVRLADGSGIEATREIRAAHPETSVLMLTSFADDEALFASIMAGASGYVLKQVRPGELLRAIRAVGAGDPCSIPASRPPVLDRLRKGKHLMKDEKLARLSPQEERILHADRRGPDEPRDRRGAPPRREDREELRQLDPVQAGGRAARRGRRLPRPPHHHARLRRGVATGPKVPTRTGTARPGAMPDAATDAVPIGRQGGGNDDDARR